MTSATVDAPSSTSIDIAKRIEDAVAFALAVAVFAVAAGAALYYTYNWYIAPPVTFLEPISTFWGGPGAVVALYVGYEVWGAAKARRSGDVLDVDGLLAVASTPLILLGLAYLTTLI